MSKFYNVINVDLVGAKTGKKLKWWERWLNKSVSATLSIIAITIYMLIEPVLVMIAIIGILYIYSLFI